MTLLYIINYLIFAAFLTLFAVEAGIGLMAILFYREFRLKIKRYLLTIWEIDGTFGVFYIVNLVATYPTLVPAISLYIPLALVASLMFLLRNVFLSYAEYFSKEEHEPIFMKLYGISTLILAFIVISILTSSVSGTGISLGGNSINIVQIFANPFNILMFLGIVAVTMFISLTYLGIKSASKMGYLLLPLSFAIVTIALYLYVPYMFVSLISNYYVPAISIALMAVVLLFKARGSSKTPHLAALWLFVSTALFGIIQYPYVFGGSASFLSFVTNTASGNALALITAIGGTLLAVSLLFMFYVSYVKKDPKPTSPGGT